MRQFLEEKLKETFIFDDNWTRWCYEENLNSDVIDNTWLDKGTSYVYKVAVVCAIDSNKCDWVHVAIGVQRYENAEFELKGTFYFNRGENDDIGRVIARALRCMKAIDEVFEED